MGDLANFLYSWPQTTMFASLATGITGICHARSNRDDFRGLSYIFIPAVVVLWPNIFLKNCNLMIKSLHLMYHSLATLKGIFSFL
jgi:hypothetical protein